MDEAARILGGLPHRLGSEVVFASSFVVFFSKVFFEEDFMLEDFVVVFLGRPLGLGTAEKTGDLNMTSLRQLIVSVSTLFPICTV